MRCDHFHVTRISDSLQYDQCSQAVFPGCHHGNRNGHDYSDRRDRPECRLLRRRGRSRLSLDFESNGQHFSCSSAGIVLGGFFGFINGLLVTKGQIASLIATLGTLSILRGIAFITTKAVSFQVEIPEYGQLEADL